MSKGYFFGGHDTDPEPAAVNASYAAKAIEAYMQVGLTAEEAILRVQAGDYAVFPGCSNMIEVAQETVRAAGILDNVPDVVRRYFDFDSYADDLSLAHDYIFIGGDAVRI